MTVRIRVTRFGGYVVDGPVELVDWEGQPIAAPRPDRVQLCRCGASANPPFCDGSHNRVPRPSDPEHEPDAG